MTNTTPTPPTRPQRISDEDLPKIMRSVVLDEGCKPTLHAVILHLRATGRGTYPKRLAREWPAVAASLPAGNGKTDAKPVKAPANKKAPAKPARKAAGGEVTAAATTRAAAARTRRADRTTGGTIPAA